MPQPKKPLEKTLRTSCCCLLTVVALAVTTKSYGATRYLDVSATGSHNGTSWTDAWTAMSQVTGLSAGDTLYISGGASGSSQSYNVSGFTMANGASGNPITYKIGQDAPHNGTAIFSAPWFGSQKNVIVSGDAGDGNKHFQVGGGGTIYSDNSANIRFAYIDFGTRAGGLHFNYVSGVEVDHCYLKKTYAGYQGFDAVLQIITTFGPNMAWNYNKIHDNIFYIPRQAANGIGDDGMSGGPQGLSVYNNRFIAYTQSNYPTTGFDQHQDGIQFTSGSYIKIYNNYFEDVSNYAIFMEAVFGGFGHCWIYNNEVRLTSAAIQSSNPPAGIYVVPTGSTDHSPPWSFQDVIVCNNLIADYGNHAAIKFNNQSPQQHSPFTSCVCSNNIAVNSSGGISPNNSMTAENNVSLTSVQAASHFVSYTPLNLSSNFHLSDTDIFLKNHGTSLSSYFTTDKDGNARPQGSAWDIGPYESGGAPPPPTPTPTPTPAPTATPTPSPPPIQDTSFDSTDGTISSPFVINPDDTISQAVQTVDPAQGGRALYRFNITETGDYVITAKVNAPTGSNNSLFVNVDAEPTAPGMIWDVAPTSGLENRSVSWRGNGTDAANQFVPKTFSLNAGVHQLIVRGREAATTLGDILFVKFPDAPEDLHVVTPSGP